MIKDNILTIRESISLICDKIKQDPKAITVVAVSKGRSSEEIKEVIASGITDIGENKIQEAILKYKELSTIDYRPSTIKWHMVGHLQSNKVKEAVKIFDLIHSVDSISIAKAIDKQAGRINKIQDILIQVNTSQEASKFGLKPEETPDAIKEMSALKSINIKGLMTIAPIVDDPEKTRPYFRMLSELRDKIYELRVTNYELRVLSMGMTADFKIALEEGANMLRLGRAVFQG